MLPITRAIFARPSLATTSEDLLEDVLEGMLEDVLEDVQLPYYAQE